jgi:WD repeat-containing protein 23
VGHTEGITNVSAKGDGRYIISNGKDQALRLWDLRKMCSNEDFDNGANRDYRLHGFDYRCVDSGLSSGENGAQLSC